MSKFGKLKDTHKEGKTKQGGINESVQIGVPKIQQDFTPLGSKVLLELDPPSKIESLIITEPKPVDTGTVLKVGSACDTLKEGMRVRFEGSGLMVDGKLLIDERYVIYIL